MLGYITHRIGLSPIVGYLLAGFAVGPNSPGFVANKELADQMAEIGVILLMFGVGLQFHLSELLKVRSVALPGAICQSLVATVLGGVVGHYVGWSWTSGLIFGLAISVASTVVLLRVLADNNDLHTPIGHIAVGWLVVEDLFTVLVLVLLPVIFGANAVGAAGIAAALLWSMVKLGILVAFTLVVGQRVLPWVLGHIAATRSRELFTLTVLVLALGIAVGAAKLFGASMALGAFLAGLVVGRSEFGVRAVADALPMRDAFAVLFFVSVGMLFSPSHLLEAPGIAAATLGIVMLGKPVAAVIIVVLLGYSLPTALAIAVALAQIGEFSFILATLGKSLGVLPDAANHALVGAAIVSISVNPLLYRCNDLFEGWARKRPRVWRWFGMRLYETDVDAPQDDLQIASDPEAHHAIVVGYGPVGRTVARLLQENGVQPSFVELNIDTVRKLRADGYRAVYGDTTHTETLIEAGIKQSIALVISTADLRGTEDLIRLAHELNPKIRVFARTTYLRDLDALRKAGADAIFSGEGEVALTMTEFILRQLGATADQIDRERDRIRKELLVEPDDDNPMSDEIPRAKPRASRAKTKPAAGRKRSPRPKR